MKKADLKFYFIILVFIVSCIVSWSLYFKTYKQTDSVNIHQFPKNLGGWSSEELLITEEEYAILETQNAFARKYKHPSGKEVFLFIVYSESNRKVSHPPEVCYQGSGVTVVNNQHGEIKVPAANLSLEINRLTLAQGRFEQVAYYWFKVGDTFTSSYWRQQFLIVFKTLFGQSSSSALIRVSATVKDAEVIKAEEDAKEFIRLIVPQLFEYLP